MVASTTTTTTTFTTPATAAKATTAITAENYSVAETQIIFRDYIKKIAHATGNDGMGEFMHLKTTANPKDRTIMRVNFDTLYSAAVLDLCCDATLVMPAETGGRYQSAWMITEEHYNPFAISQPGTYTLTEENIGCRYLFILIRTQCDISDDADMAKASALQEQLSITQTSTGSYDMSKAEAWEMDEVLAMRAEYMQLLMKKGYKCEDVFGKKGEVPLEAHNSGTAYGWGGLTADQAVYPTYEPASTAPQKLTLRDVPADAFWSITVYDRDGFPQGNVFHINSAAAATDSDGAVTINFGGDDSARNRMDVFDGWNFVLRLYQPTPAYFTGEWTKPELEFAE